VKHPLNYIIYEVTGKCNLHCRYCYNIWKVPGSEHPVPAGTYHQAVKTLKRLFRLADIKHVSFTGGEPFLSDRFEELVLYTRLKRKSVTIITNGSGATRKQYEQTVKMGVDLYEIPLHANAAAVHDRITRVEGSWQNSVDSIRLLRSLGAFVVPVVVITRMNAQYISDTLQFIRELGLRQIMLNRYNIGGEGFSQQTEILAPPDLLKETYRVANLIAGESDLKLSSNVCTPHCVLNPTDYPNIAFGNCSTDISRMPITLDVFGNIRLCNHSPIVAGNIFRQSLSEIFNADHPQQWLKDVPGFCSGCQMYERCLGGCRAAALQAGGCMQDPDPLVTFLGPSL
jgi:radical SAM protein with 4Fe4S-binding SPASM domain